MSEDFFALPPFKPSEALVALQRVLRAHRQLTEQRDGRYVMNRVVVIQLSVKDDHIEARLVKRLDSSSEDVLKLDSSLAVRKFTDEVKKRLSRWDDSDE